MITVKVNEKVGSIKPMHAVNNGPTIEREGSSRNNFETYRKARIPYARNHDASLCQEFGEEHAVDVPGIFRDFDADPYDEDSYDFAVTDAYLKNIEKAGTETFYRLGGRFEAAAVYDEKKYGAVPPKDFQKWAVICEHIIRHYNEGWAGGLHLGIEYWEIWNEPDLNPGHSPSWTGTAREYYELYKVAATHLKKAFPALKIGGPGLASPRNEEWIEGFLSSLTEDKERTPLDFFSWHRYMSDPNQLVEFSVRIRALLNKYGYTDTESIVDEWNYSTKGGAYKDMNGIKGAAFIASCMCRAQNSDIDMLMYYGAQPGYLNSLFYYYDLSPQKGYYPFKMFSKLYEKKNQIACENDVDGIDMICAADEEKDVSALISFFGSDTDRTPKCFDVNFKGLTKKKLYMYLLDDERDCELVREVYSDTVTVEMNPDSAICLSTDPME